MAEPKLTLVNPISCEPGLTGRIPAAALMCSLDVVDGEVTAINICVANDWRVTDSGKADFLNLRSRPADERVRELCKWGDYKNWPVDIWSAVLEHRAKYPHWPNPEPDAA